MIRSLTNLHGYEVVATDGAIGSVDDFLFDDERWTIRYLVVDTETWLPGRRVLISPISIRHPDWSARTMLLSITREQVRKSPDIDTHKPVSRQHESDYFRYYGYPYYWGSETLWGPASYPAALRPEQAAAIDARVEAEHRTAEAQGDEHLRSSREVIGYRLHATDGELGHVEDFLVDDQSWAIRYMVVDTSNWWLGQQVVMPPDWIQHVSWRDQKVQVDVSRQAVKDAPDYDRAAHIDRQWEAAYYAHHMRPGYWITPDDARRIKESQSYLRGTR